MITVTTQAPSSVPSPAETSETEVPAISAPPTDTPEPTVEPTPVSSASGETPDRAGSGDVLFDIYVSAASADLNGDGTPEFITFARGAGSSELTINGVSHTINRPGLAQKFAVTDVDRSDNVLELVFTDKYESGLADTEFRYSYLYWWNGAALKEMGSLMDVKFDGSWRASFNPKKYFKANGEVYCLAHSTELTDVWYMKQLKPDGADRKLKEVLYAAKPVGDPGPLKIKPGKACLLLTHVKSSLFSSSHNSMWDYADWPHSLGRAIDPNADIKIIAQEGETLKIVGVWGQNWLKLQTADNYKGWIRVDDGKVQGYWNVMHYTGEDIFDGIVVAG